MAENKRYQIVFYETVDGDSDVEAYLRGLREKAGHRKHARIILNKIVAYLNLLEEMGTYLGEPMVKHLEEEIWELRPLDDRILFAHYVNGVFVLLHHFTKKTNKTPRKEIERAKREFSDFVRRLEHNENMGRG